MPKPNKYEMHLNLNVLNHLGIKLYRNVPAVLSAEQNVRVVLYNELIEDAYRSYQAFLDKNREAGRVYRLIRDIETEAHRAN